MKESKNEETKFKTQFDKDYKGTFWTPPEMPSVTVPSMTLTVKELMERHTRGLEVGVQTREEMYLEDGEVVPRITDMNDIVYERERLEEEKQELEQKIKDERKANKRKAETIKAAKERSDKQSGVDNGQDPKPTDSPPTETT